MNRRHDDDSILSFLARGVRRVRALAVPAVRSAGHPHADDRPEITRVRTDFIAK